MSLKKWIVAVKILMDTSNLREIEVTSTNETKARRIAISKICKKENLLERQRAG